MAGTIGDATKKMSVELGNVQKTLLLPLWGRAFETRKEKPLPAGVFYYFEESEIRGFLTHLADRFPGSEILFDVCSPRGVTMANRAVIRSSGLESPISNGDWRAPRSFFPSDLSRVRGVASTFHQAGTLEIQGRSKCKSMPSSNPV